MKYIKSRSFALLGATLLLDLAFFGLTNPAHVASFWLIIAFLLGVVNLYWFNRGVVVLLGLYSLAARKQKRRLVRGLTLWGGVLLAMQSSGQLTARDLIVLLPLVVISYFYMIYARGKTLRA